MATTSSLTIQTFPVPSPLAPCPELDLALHRNRELLSLYETEGIGYVNERGLTLLHIASEMGDEAWVNFLLSKGLDPLARSNFGNTALHYAAKKNHPAIIRTLAAQIKRLGHSIDLTNSIGSSPLAFAITNHSEEAMEALLAEGADLRQTDGEGGISMLNLAISFGSPSVLRIIELGADIHSPDRNGNTPLHYAARYAQPAVVLALIQKGATLSANSQGLDQVHFAAMFGRTDILELFNKAGLDLNRTTSLGKSPIYLAAENGHQDTCKYLIEQGVEIRSDPAHNLPSLLMLVIEKNLTSFASVLIPLKIDLTKPTAEGFIPLQYALGNNHIAKLLMRYGGVPEAYRKNILYQIICYDNLELLETAFACAPDIRNTIYEDGDTIYSYAYFMQKKRILSYLGSQDEYSRFVIEAKLLSGLSGIPGSLTDGKNELRLEYSHPQFFYEYCSEVLGHEHPSFQAAFADAGLASRTAEEIHTSIISGAMTVIPTGWQGHSISIVIQGDVMIICNRGVRSPSINPMEAYIIDPSKVTIKHIEAILESTKLTFSVAEPFLYETLPGMISSTDAGTAAKHFGILHKLSAIFPKEQRLANCSAASMKTAIRAALFIEMYRRDPTSFSAKEALIISKRISAKLRETAEERCLAFAEEHPLFAPALTHLASVSSSKRLACQVRMLTLASG